MIHKYRAWDTKQKKMWSAEEMGRDQLTLSPDGQGFVNVSGTSTKLSRYLPHLIPLQYTSLKDKNGKEYYDGDITDFTIFDFNGVDVQIRGEIKWLPDAFVFGVEYFYAGETNVVDLCTLAADEEREIIGNIHSNPGLMETK